MSQKEQERAAFAEWVACHHLRDPRIERSIYLPAGSPENEVRLMEVNTGPYPDRGEPIVAVQVTPNTTDLPFKVCVADITSEEWQAIQHDPDLLPAGWRLDGYRVFQRAQ